KAVVIIGGGYIATEFASILNGLGATTYQLYRGDALLRGFDKDIRHFITKSVQESGIHLQLNTDVIAKEIEKEQKRLSLANSSTLLVNDVIFAQGRKPKVH